MLDSEDLKIIISLFDDAKQSGAEFTDVQLKTYSKLVILNKQMELQNEFREKSVTLQEELKKI